MSEGLSRFNELWGAALKNAREAGAPTQDAIADELGVTRAALQTARSKPRSIAYETVTRFCDLYVDDAAAREELLWAWLEERMFSGEIGSAVEAVMRYCQTRFDEDEYHRLRRVAFTAFEGGKR